MTDEATQYGLCPDPDNPRCRCERCVRAIMDEAVAVERERCAKIAEQTHAELDVKFSPEGCTDSALVAADRIRAIEGKP